jgi:hypothetical protein
MPEITFTFAEGAELSQDDALALADLLSKERSLAGQSGARKIREQAGGIQQTTGDAVDLTPEELSALSEVLDAVSADEMSEELTELHSALRGRG